MKIFATANCRTHHDDFAIRKAVKETCVTKIFIRIYLVIALLALSLPACLAEEAVPASHQELDIQGWKILLNKRLLQENQSETRTALKLMDAQLKRVVDAIPPAALQSLREVPIWVNPRYENASPRCEYHPGAGWLRRNGRDPRMEKAVEVTNVARFAAENIRMPYLMLHELTHAYHDRVLGFDHPEIEAAYQAAKASGGYDRVQRFSGRKMVQDRAYALSSPQEYFAENSEAYFGRNDFFPFDRTELKNHDPRCLSLIEKLWKTGTASKPFVSYDPAVQNYLKRIQSGKNEFGFREDWPGGFTAWQSAARASLIEVIGLKRIQNDLESFVATTELDASVEQDGYTRTLGHIQTEPDVQIPFYILTPNGDGPFPLAVCPHGHSAVGWHSYAGVFDDEKTRSETLARDGNIAEQLAKRGFIAIAPATRGLAKETFVHDLKSRHGKRNCRAQFMHCLISGRTAIAERVWDLQRILDWALKLPNADKSRTVMLGNSGGGVATAYTAAIDDRIKAAIPSCSFTSTTSAEGFIFHCDCCAIPGIVDWGDFSDIGGLVAPRPLLIVHGQKDGLHDREDVDRNASNVGRIYEAASASNALDQFWGTKGHQFYPQAMWQFLEEHLD